MNTLAVIEKNKLLHILSICKNNLKLIFDKDFNCLEFGVSYKKKWIYYNTSLLYLSNNFYHIEIYFKKNAKKDIVDIIKKIDKKDIMIKENKTYIFIEDMIAIIKEQKNEL